VRVVTCHGNGATICLWSQAEGALVGEYRIPPMGLPPCHEHLDEI